MSAAQELAYFKHLCKERGLEIAELKRRIEGFLTERSADAEVLEEVRQALETPKDANIVEHATKLRKRAERWNPACSRGQPGCSPDLKHTHCPDCHRRVGHLLSNTNPDPETPCCDCAQKRREGG